MARDVTARFPDGGEQFIRDEIVQQYGGEVVSVTDVADEPEDKAELGEDVTMHTMMRQYSHKDGRWCGYHSRLGKWVILALPSVHECLRSHTEGQEPI